MCVDVLNVYAFSSCASTATTYERATHRSFRNIRLKRPRGGYLFGCRMFRRAQQKLQLHCCSYTAGRRRPRPVHAVWTSPATPISPEPSTRRCQWRILVRMQDRRSVELLRRRAAAWWTVRGDRSSADRPLHRPYLESLSRTRMLTNSSTYNELCLWVVQFLTKTDSAKRVLLVKNR